MFPPPYDLDSKIQLGVEETLMFDEKRHISDSNASEEIKNALDDVEYLDSYKDHAESSIEFYTDADRIISKDTSTAKNLLHMHRIENKLNYERLG